VIFIFYRFRVVARNDRRKGGRLDDWMIGRLATATTTTNGEIPHQVRDDRLNGNGKKGGRLED